MRLRDLPIHEKLFLLILPLCLVPTLVFVFFVVLGSRLTHEETIGAELEERSSLYAHRFDGFMLERIRQWKFFSLRGMTDAITSETLSRLAERRTGPPAADALLIGSPEGATRILAINAQSTLAARLQAQGVRLADAIQPLTAPPDRGTFVEIRLPPALPGDSGVALIFIIPDRDGTMLGFAIDAVELIKQLRATLSVPPDLQIVFSEEGHILYTSRALPPETEMRILRQAQLKHAYEETFSVDIENFRHLIARSPSILMRQLQTAPDQGVIWDFMLGHNMEGYLAQQDRLIWISVMAALLLVLLMMLMVSWMARRVVRPLHELKRQAALIAQGELDLVPTVHGHDEIGQLAEAFYSMTAQLRTSYEALENQISETNLRAQHIHAFNEIAHSSIQMRNLDNIFDRLKADLRRILTYDALWIAQINPDRQSLTLSHIHPPDIKEGLAGRPIPLADSIHKTVLERGETIQAELGPHRRTNLPENALFGDGGFQSYLIAPLPGREGMMGMLGVASRSPEAYNQALAEVLTSLASAVALAMEQAEMSQRISSFADELERRMIERTAELEQARRKLTQTEKYFALGRLAANLAHEINNPLGIIKNYLQLARNSLTKAQGGRRRTDPNGDHLQIINEEVDRIARMVRKLLELHRPAEENVHPVDINQCIDEILELMAHDLERQGIEVVRHLTPGLPLPLVSADLIRQVLINLLRNAQDAMEQGGTLTVETDLVQSPEIDQDEAIRIQIIDTGCGIPPEALGQIFDPFFTTKSDGKGTGLGLCVSYSILHIYQGSIDVASTPNEGTTVTALLPTHRQTDESAQLESVSHPG